MAFYTEYQLPSSAQGAKARCKLHGSIYAFGMSAERLPMMYENPH